jgi:uncharacterized protein YqgC (DUF456 family)
MKWADRAARARLAQMEWQTYVLAALFSLLALACLGLIPLGLPGAWLMIGFAALAQMPGTIPFTSAPSLHFGWALLGVCLAIAVASEIVEAMAGAAGAKYGGATRRGMVGAFVGGIVGAIFFTGLLPIPILGTLFGGLVGAFAGAWIGEASAVQQRDPQKKFRAALGAAAGKLAGTFGKLAAGVVIGLLLVYGAFTA